MIKRIIFIVPTLWNQRDYDRFGLEILIKNGFSIKVFDCTPLINPQAYGKVHITNPMTFQGFHLFTSKNELVSKFERLKPKTDFVFAVLDDNESNRFVFELLTFYNIRFGIFSAGCVPSVPLILKLKDQLRSPVKLVEKIVRKAKLNTKKGFSNKQHAEKKPELYIVGGTEASKRTNKLVGINTKYLQCHAFDYDLFLDERDKKHQNSNEIVFLDEYIPFHSDHVYNNVPFPESANLYYPKLKRFFDDVEKQLGKPVVIAAHPRSDYKNKPCLFGNRRVVYGKTTELVHNSEFVISHCSTSLNFAVLFLKPILFITDTELDKSYMNPTIRSMANSFGKKPINIDQLSKNINWNKELKINKSKYRQYKMKYIKAEGTPDIPFWQIVANRIKQL
jgi:hypothetical protein